MSVSFLILAIASPVIVGVVAVFGYYQLRKITEASTNAVLDTAEKVFIRSGVHPSMFHTDWNRPNRVITYAEPESDDEEMQKLNELEKEALRR